MKTVKLLPKTQRLRGLNNNDLKRDLFHLLMMVLSTVMTLIVHCGLLKMPKNT